MKLLLITNSSSGGGAEKIFNSLVEGFSKCDKYELKFLYLKKSPASKLWKISGLFKFVYLVLKFRPDVVQSHLLFPNILNSFFSSLLGYKSQLVCHSSFERLNRSKASFIIRAAYKCANSVVCISDEMRQQGKAYLFRDDIEKIYNPHDLKKYQTLAEESDNFHSFGNYIISVGRLVESKRIDDLLRAFKASNTEYNLLVVGEGKEKEKLIGLSKKLNLQNRVFFLGHIQNPYPYIKHAEALLLASETEGFPNCLVESLALGVPIVTANCKTGPAEILGVSYEQNFLSMPLPSCSIYPVGDIDSLTKAIEAINKNRVDPKLLYKLVNNLDLDNIMKEYSASLKKLISN